MSLAGQASTTVADIGGEGVTGTTESLENEAQAGVEIPSYGYARRALGLIVLVLSLFSFVREIGLTISSVSILPLLVVIAGASLLWPRDSRTNNESIGDGSLLRDATFKIPLTKRSVEIKAAPASRIVAGVGAIVVGIGFFFRQHHSFVVIGTAIGPILVVMFGITLIISPLIWRLIANLRAERAERIRAEERTNVATHLHDSVLQTLALMQRQANSPDKMTSLARRQEKELRQWLYGSHKADASVRLGAALETIVDDVEELHTVKVELVVAGDADLDSRVEALLAACREAIINAAKFANNDEISVFCEVEDAEIHIFVRDRGSGFNLETIPAAHRGIRDSILGRMNTNGGRVNINSTSEGTEIELVLPPLVNSNVNDTRSDEISDSHHEFLTNQDAPTEILSSP